LNNFKKLEFFSSHGIEERNLIRKYLQELNFNAIKQIIMERFNIDSSYSIDVVNICEAIYNFVNILKKKYSKSSDILYAIKAIKSNNQNFFDIYENFLDLKICLEKILEALLINDKKEIIFRIEQILNLYLSADNVFEFLNKHILETNFRVGYNELDIIFKHTCLIFKEGLKNKNQNINFILREENLINNLNRKIFENPIQVVPENDLPNRIIYPPSIESLIEY
jgi:hypothetical protein